jgi:HPt (histidine-containing phosphotransfer) domain-containing protein
MDIPGLDIELGLRYSGNKPALYRQLLEKFAATHDRTPAEIQAALERGDSALALRLVHTLRGVAGTLGASPLQQAAGALENTLRDTLPASVMADQLTALDVLHGQLIASLRQSMAR